LERKLTAILCADVFGYSRLMGEDEEGTLRTLSACRKIIDSLIERHHGRFVNSAGDSILAEFASVVEAVNCGVSIQSTLRDENAESRLERRMQFRIGVNLGDVMVEGEQIYGDGVNVAARLESLADPGGICISGTVHEQVRDKLTLTYEDRGEQEVKNIARPVRVWRVKLDGAIPAAQGPGRIGRVWTQRAPLSLAIIAIAIATFVIVQHVSFKSQHTSVSIPPHEKPALPLPSIPSIAVLPFTNLSADPNQEYFSDGLTDQLIRDLSRLPGLFVIARNSSFSFKGKAIDDRVVGRVLGVKYLLEGSVRKTPEQVRIGVELVDASSRAEMWSENYDRPLKDIFAVQDEIVRKVTTTLDLLLELQKFPRYQTQFQRTQNLQAFDDYLRGGEYSWRLDQDDNQKARHWAAKAIELDPEYANAFALLASTYTMAVLFRQSTNPAEDLSQAYRLAQKALTLDDSNSQALTALCTVGYLAKRFDEAVAACRRAVARDPNFVGGYVELSSALVAENQPEEAVRAANTAMRLDPIHQDFYAYFIAAPLNEMGRYQEAIPLLKRHIQAYPDNVWAHVGLAVDYIELGREQEARAEAAEVKRISPDFTYADFTRDPTFNRHFENDLRRAGIK
jgi:adenylate cyclase